MKRLLLVTALSTLALTACDQTQTSTQIERQKQEELSKR